MLKFKILSVIALIFCYNYGHSQNYNPYSMFGYKGKVLKTPLELSNKNIKLLNTNNNEKLKAIIINLDSKQIEYLDNNDNIYQKDSLLPNYILRFLSSDPHSQNYPSLNPYNYVANMPIRAIDPDGRDIHVLFYTYGNDTGDEMFKSSANTRRKNIESSSSFNSKKDKVLTIKLKDIGSIKFEMEKVKDNYSKQYGKTTEVGIWSHAGFDGPIGSATSSLAPISNSSTQMEINGGWNSIEFNWSLDNPSMTFYGCKTGNDMNPYGNEGSFSRQISKLQNFENVQVAGQTSSAYPSYDPYVRITSLTRSKLPNLSFDKKDTYMVGGNSNEGKDALWFSPSKSPKSNPMNVYLGGTKLKSSFQTNKFNKNPIE